MKALKPRGINAEYVNKKEDALNRLKKLIPPGAEVMTGGSTTLDQIGFTEILKSGKHPWKNLKDEIPGKADGASQKERNVRILSGQRACGYRGWRNSNSKRRR